MYFDKSCQSIGELKIDFLNFTNQCVEKSQTCNYFENFKYMVELVQQLIEKVTGRYTCLLHRTFYQYTENLTTSVTYHMDFCIWKTCVVYLKNIQKYSQKFMKGPFVVKQRNGSFNAVARDMKLEQTIQHLEKELVA